VDDFTRESLALIADTSLPGLWVVRELTAIAAWRGRPVMCVSDNGTGLTGIAVLRWSQEMQIEWHYTAPGKPTQNAFIESFNALLYNDVRPPDQFEQIPHEAEHRPIRNFMPAGESLR
jgi:putative transposase